MLKLLGIDLASVASPILLVPPRELTLDESALYTQLAFEKLNAPGLSILSPNVAALFALNTTSGVVLHVGRHASTATVVTDSVVRECTAAVAIGQADVEAALERALLVDEGVDKELREAAEVAAWAPGQKEALVRELRGVIIAECADDIDVPAESSGARLVQQPAPVEDDAFDVAKKLTADAMPPPPPKPRKPTVSKAAAAAAAADVVALTLPSLGKEVSVGQVRHHMFEPLLRGTEAGGDTIWEAVGRALDHPCLTAADRMAAWESVAVTGELAKFRSFPTALVTYLAPFLLSSTELVSDSQPARLMTSDYLANFKGCTNELAPFLGASMVVKTSFSDAAGKHCVTKIDYNAKGPASIYTAMADA